MRNPDDLMSDFDAGDPVNPPQPSEIRRRGDRIRRRNTTFAAVGAAVAVAVIATPIAVLSGGSQDDTAPDPAGPGPTSSSSTTASGALLSESEIPSRAPRLTEWRLSDDDFAVLGCAPVSGDGLAGLGADDSAEERFSAYLVDPPVEQTGPGTGKVGNAVLDFGSADDASAAYDTVTGWIEDCKDLGTERAVASADANAETASATYELADGEGTWVRRDIFDTDVCDFQDGCDGLFFEYQGVARIGSRLVVVTLGEAGGPVAPEKLSDSMETLFDAAVTKAGGQIESSESVGSSGAEGAGDPGGESSAGAGQPLALADFPLTDGWSAADPDVEVNGPSEDMGGVNLPEGFCEQSLFLDSGYADRLAAYTTGPEYSSSRELLRYDSEADAQGVLDDLSDAIGRCPTTPDGLSGTIADDIDGANETAGRDTLTFSYLATEPYGTLYQVARVGSTLLLTSQTAEWAPTSAPDGLTALDQENQPLAELMADLEG